MDGDFGDDVRVEAVAEVNRVDVVAVRKNRSARGAWRKERGSSVAMT